MLARRWAEALGSPLLSSSSFLSALVALMLGVLHVCWLAPRILGFLTLGTYLADLSAVGDGAWQTGHAGGQTRRPKAGSSLQPASGRRPASGPRRAAAAASLVSRPRPRGPTSPPREGRGLGDRACRACDAMRRPRGPSLRLSAWPWLSGLLAAGPAEKLALAANGPAAVLWQSSRRVSGA